MLESGLLAFYYKHVIVVIIIVLDAYPGGAVTCQTGRREWKAGTREMKTYVWS